MATNIQSFAGQVDIASNLEVGTANLFVDSVNNRVGIGKTNPGYTLDIPDLNFTGDIFQGGVLLNTTAWNNAENGDISFVGGNVTVDNTTFHVDSVTNRVGMGTTLPQQKLEVKGGVRAIGVQPYPVILDAGILDFTEKQRLTGPTSRQQLDLYGKNISISGNGSHLVVGAYDWDGPFGSTQGASYIFSYNGSTWDYRQELTGEIAGSSFGYDVSMSENGSYIIVGAPGRRQLSPLNDEGKAFIFYHNGSSWVQQQELLASDKAEFDSFGYSVTMSGNGSYALVGAIGWDDLPDSPSSDANGAIYVFSRDGTSWTEEQIIGGPDSDSLLGLNSSISSDGSYIITGTPFWDGPGPIQNKGTVYIYSHNGSSWVQQQQLTASDGSANENFGREVDISGDGSYAVIGSSGPQFTSGSAYIFSRDGTSWTEMQKILSSDIEDGDYFSSSVSMSYRGGYVAVGAKRWDNFSGSTYIFNYDGTSWVEKQTLTPSTDYEEEFGNSVSISDDGSRVVSGTGYLASGPSPASRRTGVYVFHTDKALRCSTDIEAAGTILSFTGQHICVGDGPMEQGCIVSANKNKYVTLNGSLTTGGDAIRSSESLPVVSLSRVAKDKTVFGVVDHIENSGIIRTQRVGATITRVPKELGDDRVVVNSLGEGAIWAINTNGNVCSGDFLTSSNVSGYAEKQDESYRCNYTVAKSTMDCNFTPEQTPVKIIKKGEDGSNILDAQGQLQWENTEQTVPQYKVRYLTIDGQLTDETNAVYTAAYIGCTYHCG
jgi:hypothetical protein